MYHKGIDHPDNEPRRNNYTSDPKRKSKFTEDVAKDVVDGDLYFSMRVPAALRFYVPVEAGEHGQEKAGLLCVTHIFKKSFPDLPGRWEAYDGGGNLVIQVRSTSGHLSYEAMTAIEQALYHTPLGRAVGRDALRPMAQSLLKTFGIELDDEYQPTFTVDPDAEKLAKDALRDLLTFTPETGYDERLGKIGADADGVGFAKDKREYAKLLNGESDGFEGESRNGGNPLPFLSQPVFYAVLGYKGNGRAFQSRIDALCEAVGLDQDDL